MSKGYSGRVGSIKIKCHAIRIQTIKHNYLKFQPLAPTVTLPSVRK